MVGGGRGKFLLFLGVPERVHEGALVTRELGGAVVLMLRVEVFVKIALGLVGGGRRGIKSSNTEAIVGLAERILRLLVLQGRNWLLAGHIHRVVVEAGAGELLLLVQVIDEQVVLGANRVTGRRSFSFSAEERRLFVVGGTGFAILAGVENLVDVELFHLVAGDAEGVLLGLGEGVSIFVILSGAVDLDGAVVAGGNETLGARVEALASVGSLLDAKVGFQLVAERFRVGLGALETGALLEGKLLFAGGVVDANCASVRHK